MNVLMNEIHGIIVRFAGRTAKPMTTSANFAELSAPRGRGLSQSIPKDHAVSFGHNARLIIDVGLLVTLGRHAVSAV